MAQTLTSKLKLAKHDTGDLNWGADANANADALDAHVQQAILRPPRTLTATLGGGAAGANLLGNTAYFYKVTAVNAVGETTEGQIPAVGEAMVTQPATPLPVILQWETVTGATGYKIYKSTVSGQEQFLAQVSGQATSTYTDTGNTATTSAAVPLSNTARTSVSQIIAGANVTVSPPDGTGAVTINVAAGSSAPPNASATVAGVTELSVAPANPNAPIAVGVNDPSVTNSRTPTGAAGGDLSGTYPNPSVAKVNGTSVPAAPSAGQVLTATGPSAAAWQAPAAGSTPGYPSILGNGSDGNVEISANTQLAANENFGGIQVAVKNYQSLTIDAGAVLSLASGVVGAIIRCQGTVTINGAIKADAAAGNGGGTSSPGGPGLGILCYAVPSSALVPTLGPAAGGTGTYSGSPSGSGQISCGGGGGGYGYGGTDNGGAGGPAAAAGLVALFQKISLRNYETCFLAGSGGGTNGGGGQASGSGVSGGGFIYIFANNIVIASTGLISANGGSANQTLTFAQGSGVGNGGGGGGFILLAYNSLTNNGTVQANGGQGGPSENESQALTAGPAGGVNTTINGTPAAGATGGGSNFFGTGGSGSSGLIIGVQIPT